MVDDLLDELVHAVEGRVVTAPDALGRFQRDGSHLIGRAIAAVLPANEADVVRTIQWGRSHRVPLVARGGGTSLDGESVPTAGGVVIDFSGWNRILEVDATHRVARVQPGVINRDLHRELSKHHLFFPPNPGSWATSTLGGNAATNASGPRSYRYGSTRRWVREARVVLGTGESVQLGHRTTKRSAGPELLDWLVGSEGALGWFVELSVALAPLPEIRTGFIVPKPETPTLGQVVRALVEDRSLPISAIEFLDEACARELKHLTGGRLPEGQDLILLELETSESDETRHLEQLLDTVRRAGISEDPVVYSNADDLWTLRGQSTLALDAALGERVREDVAVPVGSLDSLLHLIRVLADRHAVPVYVFGHVGDGNLHPNFAVDPASPTADALRSELWQGVLELSGTVSAEHGVGSIKRAALSLEHPAVTRQLWQDAKRRLDPDGILNPGKLIAPADSPTVPADVPSLGGVDTGGTGPE